MMSKDFLASVKPNLHLVFEGKVCFLVIRQFNEVHYLSGYFVQLNVWEQGFRDSQECVVISEDLLDILLGIA